MHIINLTVQCKNTIGDGTKIVCLNSDYVVRINAIDCGTFTNAPVKKLIVRRDREYYESAITEVKTDEGTFLQAVLPPIERGDYIDLGVCGKETEDSNPVYTSTPARYACEKSVLTDVVVLKTDPVLAPIDITENGKYRAVDRDVDGFFEVDVQVSSKVEERRTVDLSMHDGNQVISPSGTNRTMTEVTIQKPTNLIPGNIRKDINIGGVVGSYEEKLTEIDIYEDGNYTPPAGFKGFSAVRVSAGKSNLKRTMYIGDTFVYNYDSSVELVIDIPGIVKYENDGDTVLFTAISIGSCQVTIKDYNSDGTLLDTVHYSINVVEEGISTLEITENGTYEVSEYIEVVVNVGGLAEAEVYNGTVVIS